MTMDPREFWTRYKKAMMRELIEKWRAEGREVIEKDGLVIIKNKKE